MKRNWCSGNISLTFAAAVVLMFGAVVDVSQSANSNDADSDGAAYDTVLAIVILELIFAFGVGIVCVIFSFSLVRSLGDAEDEMAALADGELPPNRRSNLYKNTAAAVAAGSMSPYQQSGRAVTGDLKSFQSGALRSSDSLDAVSEMDSETQQPGVPQPGLLHSFTSYLKLW